MGTTPPVAPARSAVHRAAYNGLYLGIYLSLLALVTGLSQSFMPASLLAWAATIGLPFMMYALLRRSLAETEFNAPFSELWAEGIVMLFLAGTIQAVVIYAGLKYLAPDYIADSVDMAIEFFAAQNNPAGDQWAETLGQLRRTNVLPAPTDVVAQIMSMNLIGGTFLTLVVAAVLKSRYSSEERRRRYAERFK